MSRLACWSCGRSMYTVAPLEALFAEERRCPRCGAFLQNERRENDRRNLIRRGNPPLDPGPPDATGERREEQRRDRQRRGTGAQAGKGLPGPGGRTGPSR